MGFKSVFGKIWKGIKVGLDVGSFLNPVVRVIDAAVDTAEAAFHGQQSAGASKAEMVVAVSDPIIDAMPISDEQKAQLRAAREKAVTAAVAARNATVAMKDAYQEIDDLMDSFKTDDDE